jgi:hypothetical protein
MVGVGVEWLCEIWLVADGDGFLLMKMKMNIPECGDAMDHRRCF